MPGTYFVRRFAILLPIALAAALLPGPAVAGTAAAPTARFTWEMDQRYGDATGDGFFDPSRQASDVQAPFRVHFNGCDSAGGGSAIRTYRWTFGDVVRTTEDCEISRGFTREGVVDVQLVVITAAGNRDSARQPVRVKDLLVVSIGDSIASGEGNPYATEHLVNVDVNGNEIRIPKDATWQDERCHRSGSPVPPRPCATSNTTSARTSASPLSTWRARERRSAEPDPGRRPRGRWSADPYVGIEPTGRKVRALPP